MTLILAMANPQQVVLVSDRRLTYDGHVIEDESNKAAVFCCRNARLAVAYTGLAQAGSFLTRRWLPVALMESAAPDYLMGPTIKRFRERATRDFASIPIKRPSDKRLSVLLAGYCYDETPPRCYCWLVSNFERFRAQIYPSGEPSDQFIAEYYRDKRPTEKYVDILLSVGVNGAVNQRDFEALYTLLHGNKPAQALVGKGIDVLRTAAESVPWGQLIGKQCTSIVLPSDPDEDAVGEYHSAEPTRKYYYPSFINARGDGSGVYTTADPCFEICNAIDQPLLLSVPKVGRNHPCPCGSGLKYKNCHGRS